MNSAVPGLARALKRYDSDKVRERADGATELREIFSNRENIDIFHTEAESNGGSPWVLFFQVLFQVVVLEKQAATKTSTGASTVSSGLWTTVDCAN